MWLFTGVYSPPSTSNREEFWNELNEIKERWSGPWVVGGDFNVIGFVNKKRPRGRITRSVRDFEEFVTMRTSGIFCWEMLNILGLMGKMTQFYAGWTGSWSREVGRICTRFTFKR